MQQKRRKSANREHETRPRPRDEQAKDDGLEEERPAAVLDRQRDGADYGRTNERNGWLDVGGHCCGEV